MPRESPQAPGQILTEGKAFYENPWQQPFPPPGYYHPFYPAYYPAYYPCYYQGHQVPAPPLTKPAKETEESGPEPEAEPAPPPPKAPQTPGDMLMEGKEQYESPFQQPFLPSKAHVRAWQGQEPEAADWAACGVYSAGRLAGPVRPGM